MDTINNVPKRHLGKIDSRNLLLAYYLTTRQFRFDLYGESADTLTDDLIVSTLEEIGKCFDSREKLEWFDQNNERYGGLAPNLRYAGELNRFIFGNCSNLTGVISPDLYGDVSCLTGELSTGLKGYIPILIEKEGSLISSSKISRRLTGEVTGLTGDLGWSIYPNEMLFGSLNKDLVGNITCITGEISEKLTGDITGLMGKVDPALHGDCTKIKGTITGLTGDCTGLMGRCSGLVGDCTGVIGDCTGLEGDCSGLQINLDKIPPYLRPNRIENFPELQSKTHHAI